MKKEIKYASLLQRFWAVCGDIFFLSPIIIIYFIVSFLYEDQRSSDIALIISTLLCTLYEVLLLSGAKQATLGMRKEKIKMVDVHGNRISIVRSIYRYMLYGITISLIDKISSMIGLGGIFSLMLEIFIISLLSVHPKKQTIYDIIAGTYIIYEEDSEIKV
jgi:uncharacterized RDD family membrane protein YckC